MRATMLERDPETLEESLAELTELASRRSGKIPPDALARHVLAVTDGGDWPLRRAALEALLRRLRFASRDALAVARPPARRRVLGLYETAVKPKGRASAGAGRARRPYRTELSSLEPLRGSCTCPDFLRGSLGLCKHLLCVVAAVYADPRRVAAAESIREQTAACGRERSFSPSSTTPRLHVTWDPVRPLAGAGDRLAGIRVRASAGVDRSRTSGQAGSRVLHWCVESPRSRSASQPQRDAYGGGRVFLLDPRSLSDPSARCELASDLLQAISRTSGDAAAISAEVAVSALLAEELERAERSLDCARSAGALERELRTLGRKLYPYQREGIRSFFATGRLLLADDMGLGKTTQAIAACHALQRARRIRRGVVIVPTALKPQWLREWAETTDVPLRTVDGSPEARARAFRRLGDGFVILGYEQFLRDHALVRLFAPEIAVLDEAQRIKNWATKSSFLVKGLDARYRLALTGTPLENRLEELASLLDWIDDTALAPKWRLEPWHTFREGDGASGRSGARHLDTLRTRLSGCVLRRVRREVLDQLPPRTDTRVPVAMTEQQRDAHDELIRPIAQLLHRARQRPLTQAEFLRLMTLLATQRIISNGLGQLRFEEIWPAYAGAQPDEALLEGLFAPKLIEFRALVRDIAATQERKIVVFSQWRRMLRLAEWSVRDILAENGLRAAFFTGAESQALRTRSIVDFHDEPDVRLLFLSDAGGVGLNLQRAASCCINLELPWNPAVLEQRVGRIHRLGQSRPIDVYHLVNEYGIEARIANLVAAKRALFSGLFDGTTNELRFEGRGSFIADVERLVGEPASDARTSVPSPRERDGLPQEDATETDDDLLRELDGDAGDEVALREAGDAGARPSRSAVAVGPSAAASARPPIDEPGMRGVDAIAEAGAIHDAAGTPTADSDASDADGSTVRQLFSRLRVERTPAGGLVLEAPPEVASDLAALFEGMARLMHAAAPARSSAAGRG